MKNFKEEIENSGMSFTEGGSYEAKNKENIYLNLALCSEEELQQVYNLLDDNDQDLGESLYDMFKALKAIKEIPYMCYNSYSEIWLLYPNTINLDKTEVNFKEFKEIMGATETGAENTQVEIFDIDFGGNCMARMEIQNGKFKFTNAMNGGGYPIAIEDIKITPTN